MRRPWLGGPAARPGRPALGSRPVVPLTIGVFFLQFLLAALARQRCGPASPAEESSTVHGSSATSSGTAAVRWAPLPSSRTVRRGVPNFSATAASSADTSSRSRWLGLEYRGQLGDLGLQRLPLALELEPVEFGQSAQRRVEYVLCLDRGQVEDGHQPLLGRSGVVARPDDLDDLVDVEQRDDQAVDQVQPVGPLGPAELGAAPDHLEPVVNVNLQQLAQPEHSWLAVHERHVVDAERVFHRGEPVKLLEHGLGVEAVAESRSPA